MTRQFVDKVASDNREYVQSLLDENRRLAGRVAELDAALSKTRAEMENRNHELTERYFEIEQQNSSLASLYVASYQLSGTLDRQRVLAAIQEIVINLIGSEELAIWQVDEELDILWLVGGFGIALHEWAGLPLGSGIIGGVALTGERFVAAEDAHGFGHEENLTACIPLKLDDRVIGVIGIFRLLPQKQGLEAADYELFDLLGSHAATALYCTQLDPSAVEAEQ